MLLWILVGRPVMLLYESTFLSFSYLFMNLFCAEGIYFSRLPLRVIGNVAFFSKIPFDGLRSTYLTYILIRFISGAALRDV